MLTEMTSEEFWSRVERGPGCWTWKSGFHQFGYGQFRRAGKNYTAHRFAYALEFGPIPDGLCVLHHCDNPPCVRPDHLFLGTMSDNAQDCRKKNRHGAATHPEAFYRGTQIALAKLNDDTVRISRALRERGWPVKVLAQFFGVNKPSMYKALSGQTWAHVS